MKKREHVTDCLVRFTGSVIKTVYYTDPNGRLRMLEHIGIASCSHHPDSGKLEYICRSTKGGSVKKFRLIYDPKKKQWTVVI